MRFVVAMGIAAGVLCLNQPSFATDLFTPEPEAPVYELPPIWTGFYIGGHIGGARGEISVTDVYDYNGDPTKSSSFNTTGVIGGVQIGYNLQHGNLVYGIEADIGYLGLSGDKNVYLPPAHPKPENDLNAKYSMSGGLYGDLTARLGYATENTLFYLKGGAAFLNADFKANYVGENFCTVQPHRCGRDATASTFDFSGSDTLWGWTIGAGVEYALTSSWSFKLEYQHFDFGSMSFDHNGKSHFAPVTCGGCASTLKGNVEFSPTVDAVKVGVNYHFGRDASPMK